MYERIFALVSILKDYILIAPINDFPYEAHVALFAYGAFVIACGVGYFC